MAAVSVEALQRSTISASAAKRRVYRRQMIAMIAGSYVLDALILYAYHLAGTTVAFVPLSYAALGLGTSAIYLVLSESGVTERTGDHYFTVWQIGVASAIQFGFLFVAPEVGFVFLVTLFIVFGFGSLRLSAKQAAIAWGMATAGIAAFMLFTDKIPDIPATTHFERVISLFLFALALGRCVFLGLYGSSLRETLQERNTELRKAFGKIEQLASHDELTGTLNRRSLMAAIEAEIARASRANTPFCVAILDLDWFKTVNDRFGHLAGDDVLKKFADVASASMRASDQLGRYGGEEFMLILPGASESTALAVVNRIRNAIAGGDWKSIALGLAITVSAGVSAYRTNDKPDDLLGRADAALYRAKQEGRNRALAA